jgi:ABC-type amino acid transport substrate-binding protein
MVKSRLKRRIMNVHTMICVVAWLWMLPIHAHAGSVMDRVLQRGEIRVCIWPDYYGVTFRNPHTRALQGIDIDLSQAFAKDLGVKLIHVDSSFTSIGQDLTSDLCDIAMFAVGITPQRTAQMAFSEPYLRSDIYGITTKSHRAIRQWEDIDRPGVLVGVQAGTFMEPVMRERLKEAKLMITHPPTLRERELQAGRIDVFMTDYPYSRRLLDNLDWVRVVAPSSPYHILPYAYAVKPGDEQWLERVNDFVRAIKSDGRLLQAAQKFGLTPIVVR